MIHTDIPKMIDQVKTVYNESLEKAEGYFSDKSKLAVIAEEANVKGKRSRNAIAQVWNHLELFYSILGRHSIGEGPLLPKNDLVKIIAALLYFISPIDVLPDFVPIVGFIDDVFIIGLVASSTHSILQKHNLKKEQQMA
ncbi:MAG: YkvA family protein [Salibacteraceae bacterium]